MELIIKIAEPKNMERFPTPESLSPDQKRVNDFAEKMRVRAKGVLELAMSPLSAGVESMVAPLMDTILRTAKMAPYNTTETDYSYMGTLGRRIETSFRKIKTGAEN